LLTDIGRPFARRISCSWAGNADDAPTPYPAVLLAPSATIWALALEMAAKPSSATMIERMNMGASPWVDSEDNRMASLRVNIGLRLLFQALLMLSSGPVTGRVSNNGRFSP
jgi:hypothetical protein